MPWLTEIDAPDPYATHSAIWQFDEGMGMWHRLVTPEARYDPTAARGQRYRAARKRVLLYPETFSPECKQFVYWEPSKGQAGMLKVFDFGTRAASPLTDGVDANFRVYWPDEGIIIFAKVPSDRTQDEANTEAAGQTSGIASGQQESAANRGRIPAGAHLWEIDPRNGNARPLWQESELVGFSVSRDDETLLLVEATDAADSVRLSVSEAKGKTKRGLFHIPYLGENRHPDVWGGKVAVTLVSEGEVASDMVLGLGDVDSGELVRLRDEDQSIIRGRSPRFLGDDRIAYVGPVSPTTAAEVANGVFVDEWVYVLDLKTRTTRKVPLEP